MRARFAWLTFLLLLLAPALAFAQDPQLPSLPDVTVGQIGDAPVSLPLQTLLLMTAQFAVLLADEVDRRRREHPIEPRDVVVPRDRGGRERPGRSGCGPPLTELPQRGPSTLPQGRRCRIPCNSV